MGKAEDKMKLLDFLDKKACDPVLKRSKDDFDTDTMKKFEHVKQATENDKERFHNYSSAEEIKTNFRRNLNSDSAKKIHRELKDHDLPRLPELEDRFYKLCDKLGLK